MSPSIALASCRDLPSTEVDDVPLVHALESRGARVETVPWDDQRADWGAFDLVLLRTTWDYVPRREEFCRWCERVESVTRLENPAALVRWNTDKRYLFELEEAGLATIPTRLVESPHDLAEGVASFSGARKLFLKPVVGADANSTLPFANDPAGRERAIRFLEEEAAHGPFLVQPFLASVETHGEVSLFWLGSEWTHAVRKVPKTGDWRVQDNHGATDGPHEPSEAERQLARRALEYLGAPLYLRVDFLTGDSDEPLIVELELVEPSLFFRHRSQAADVLARNVLARLHS